MLRPFLYGTFIHAIADATMTLSKLSLVFLLSFFLLGCDKNQNAAFDAALDRLEPEILAAEELEEKMSLLGAFRAKFKGHSKIGEIDTRINALQKEIDKTNQEKEKLGYSAQGLLEDMKKGSLEAMSKFSIVAIANRSRATDDVFETLSLPGFDGTNEISSPTIFTSPATVRSMVYSAIFKTERELVKACPTKCQNKLANTFLEKSLGMPLFEEDGSMNPAGTKKLIGLLKSDQFGGVSGQDLNQIYGPSIEQILKVREAIRKAGDEKVMAQFHKIKSERPRGVTRWYTTFARENASLKAIAMRKYPMGKTFGFWIRRMDDKSADDIEAFLKSFQENK